MRQDSLRDLHDEPDAVERLLDGRLTADEQARWEQHLEACAACRGRLESLAADRNYWTEAASHLRTDVFDEDLERRGGSSAGEVDGSEPAADYLSVLRITDYFAPTDDPKMLGRFGGYEIAGIIGSGGMGVVLKGYESALDRYVAIKLLAPHLATGGAARARFAREARAAAAVLHENVVAIYRVSEAERLPYLVMSYMPGESLQKRLDDEGPLQLAAILRIGMQIASGLAAAHAQGLVHRDIKPGNILLGKEVERVTITDFGLARAADDAGLTRSGVIAGTPQYMSPEQARGEAVDGRSDLFSLGSVLYAMCAGRPPFRAQTTFGVLQRISESEPTPIRLLSPETPEWLCEIVEKLHAKKADERFQTAGEVVELLGRWLAHVQQPTVIPAPSRLGGHRRLVRRRWIAAVAAIAVGMLGLGIATAWLPGLGNRDRGPAGRSESTAAAAVQHDPPAGMVFDDRTLSEKSRAIRWQVEQFKEEISQEEPAGDEAAWNAKVAELRSRTHGLVRPRSGLQAESSGDESRWDAEMEELRSQVRNLGRRIDEVTP